LRISHAPQLGSFTLALLRIISLLLTGSPVATYIASPQFILHHPLEAGGIALLSAIVVLIIGFFARFLNQLQNDWANASAEWFKRLLEDLLFSYHYQEHYYKWLRNGELKFLDERGLSTLGAQSMILEQIFVELAVDYTFPHKSDNFLEEPQQELPERLREGPHSVWEYLSIQKKRQKMEIKPRLVILGPPGSGKTTLLQHITLVLANRKSRKNYHHKYGFQLKLPFLLSLRKYSELTKSSSLFSLVEAVQTELILAENSASKRWVERQLREGHCIILLDGLDEIGNLGSRRKMVNWVQDQIKQFGNNCFVITSRRFGYLDNPLIGVTVLGIQNFTISQMEDFIYKWHAAQNNKNQKQRGYEVAIERADPKDLLQRLRKNFELFKLAGNPLMLDMIARIHFYRKELPDSRVELYKEIFEVFLGKRRIAREVEQELTPEQMQRVLQHLAYSMMVNKELEIQEVEAEDVIKRPLADESELLTPKAYLKKVYEISQILQKVEEGPDRYTFVHRTFQEYLAAKYIQEHSLERVLEEQLESDWCHETILLYCAIADATPIILACLNKALSKEILELVLRLREEPIYAKPDVFAQLDGVISKGAEDTDPKMWHMIAEAGLKHRTEHMLPQKNIYLDRSFITSVEYQLFLDQPHNHGLQPDHWQNDRFSRGQGLYPVLGVRPLDVVAFCKWLTTWEASEWEYRLPTRKELVDITVTQPDIGYWFNDGNNYEVNWIGGGPTASSILNQDQLKIYLEQDNPQFNPLVLGTLPDTDDYRNLVAHIPFVNHGCQVGKIAT
jgi:energy-coupling factor transporter ATP-binding protein EcfA2